MQHSDKERMVFCPECNNMEYPKICPAVIVGVTHGNRLLMSQIREPRFCKNTR